MKKSFILYNDLLDVLDVLSPTEAGELFTVIRDYTRGEEVNPSKPVAIAFTAIKNSIDRDCEKWETIRKRNVENGKKGGRPIKEINPKEPKKPTGLSGNPKNPVSVNVNVSDNVNVNDNDNNNVNNKNKDIKYNIYTSEFASFWEKYPRRIGKGKAFREFQKVKSERVDILEGLEKQLPSLREREIQYIPHPSTWLSQRRWEDEVESGIKKESKMIAI